MASKSWFPTPWFERGRDIEPFRAFRSQLDTLFEDWFGRGMDGMMTPRIDVSETEKDVVLAVELPGVEEKDIDLSIAGDRLTIKGEKKSEQEEKKDDEGRVYHRVERSYGSFQRIMKLPFKIEPEQVSAVFKDGVLKITLPKPADAIKREEPRKIEVKRAM